MFCCRLIVYLSCHFLGLFGILGRSWSHILFNIVLEHRHARSSKLSFNCDFYGFLLCITSYFITYRRRFSIKRPQWQGDDRRLNSSSRERAKKGVPSPHSFFFSARLSFHWGSGTGYGKALIFLTMLFYNKILARKTLSFLTLRWNHNRICNVGGKDNVSYWIQDDRHSYQNFMPQGVFKN